MGEIVTGQGQGEPQGQNEPVVDLAQAPEVSLEKKPSIDEIASTVDYDHDRIRAVLVSKGLNNDRDYMLAAIKERGSNLQFCSEALRNDPDLVIRAVASAYSRRDVPLQHFGFSSPLEYASDELKQNNDFVRRAIRHDWKSLEFAGDQIKNDPIVIMEALHQLREEKRGYRRTPTFVEAYKHHSPMEYASEQLKQDKAFILQALERTEGEETILTFADPKIKDDKDVLLSAVARQGLLLQSASDRLKQDPEIVLKAVENNGQALGYAAAFLKDNEQIVQEAVLNDGMALQFASSRLRNDEMIVESAVSGNPDAIIFAMPEAKRWCWLTKAAQSAGFTNRVEAAHAVYQSDQEQGKPEYRNIKTNMTVVEDRIAQLTQRIKKNDELQRSFSVDTSSYNPDNSQAQALEDTMTELHSDTEALKQAQAHLESLKQQLPSQDPRIAKLPEDIWLELYYEGEKAYKR